MKRILIPTDFSTLAQSAVDFARDLCQDDGEIHLLHVVERVTVLDETGYQVTDDEVVEAEKMMRHFVKKLPFKPTVAVKLGDLEKEMNNYIKLNDIDLVLMGSHGASGLKEIFIGSHAEKIVRTSLAPTLVIKSQNLVQPIRNLLFASDFEELADADMGMLKEIQTRFGCKIMLLSILFEENKDDRALRMLRMAEFIEQHQLVNVAAEVVIAPTVSRGILEYARQREMDLIALGTHGYTGLEHWLKGSIAERIVNRTNKPVLTFKLLQDEGAVA